MTKRKREDTTDEIKGNKLEKTKITGSVPKNLEYYCYYHENDPEICKIYECAGYRSKENEEKKDYLN